MKGIICVILDPGLPDGVTRPEVTRPEILKKNLNLGKRSLKVSNFLHDGRWQ